MKLSLSISIIINIILAYFYFFNPQKIIEREITLVKGNEFIVNRKVEPKIIIDLKLYEKKVDTLFKENDKHNFITKFNIGSDTLGVSGIVEYKEPYLSHKSLAFRYPRETVNKLRVDTLKIKETEIKKGLGYGLHLTAGYDPFLNEPTINFGIGIHWTL